MAIIGYILYIYIYIHCSLCITAYDVCFQVWFSVLWCQVPCVYLVCSFLIHSVTECSCLVMYVYILVALCLCVWVLVCEHPLFLCAVSSVSAPGLCRGPCWDCWWCRLLLLWQQLSSSSWRSRTGRLYLPHPDCIAWLQNLLSVLEPVQSSKRFPWVWNHFSISESSLSSGVLSKGLGFNGWSWQECVPLMFSDS